MTIRTAGIGARRMVGNRTLAAAMVVSATLTMAWASGGAQVTAPRYRSPIEAPTPQLKLPTPPPVSSPNAAVLEDVVARVNDQIIDRSDVQRKQEQLQQDAQQGKIPASEVPGLQRDLLRNMVDEQLLLSRGKELDLNVDAEVVRQMDEIRKQNHMDSMEALEKAVRQSGISYEDWRADIKNRLIEQTVIRDEVGRTLRRPNAKDEQAYYDAHKQDFVQPEKVRLSEILIPTPENATDAQVAQAQTKAEDVAAKLKGGAKFDDLAKQYSGGQTADKGGDLGLFERGQLAKVLEDQTFPLKPGEWTAPIRTRQGFVVLEVTDHLAGGVPPLKDVEEQVQEGMYQEQMQPALRKYLTDLRDKAYIDISPGFVDSGASAKEVKPIFASNTPPPMKKKTAVQKARLVSTRAAAVSTAGTKDASASKPAGMRTVATSTGKKRKKIKREKIRYGQAPENALPAGAPETASAGVDQGAGATPGTLAAASSGDQASNALTASDVDPLAPIAPVESKTRYSDRAKTEKAAKQAKKAETAKAKALETATPLTQTETVTQNVQDSALGLGGDTAAKKKKKKVKDAPKERLQHAAPAPPAPKPDATPIPPKSVRDNGEDSGTQTSNKTTLAPATAPAPGASIDPQPSTPANPNPVPPPL